MELSPTENPVELFNKWLAEAVKTEPADPEAAALATVGKGGNPSVRMVLVKFVNRNGFHFYTNMESKKGLELAENPQAALCFYWKSQQRQVRVEGRAEVIAAPLVDAYFKSRHYLSRLGAWASRQSRTLENRDALETRVKEYEQKFQGQDIPRPPHWGGYCIVPEKIEFWQQGEGRLHDRFLYTRESAGWVMERLNP